ncbi:hypothetical protein I7V34_21935 [Bacillus sp. V3]|nr:hypothetical protein I7V34_21935 [Bacillus sp. V3]
MKKKLSFLSFVLFLIGALFYVMMLFGRDEFLLAGVSCSAAGLIIALFSERGTFKKIAIAGNVVIVGVALIVPFIVTTFFWNTP